MSNFQKQYFFSVSHRGFTRAELVVVMVLVAIIFALSLALLSRPRVQPVTTQTTPTTTAATSPAAPAAQPVQTSAAPAAGPSQSGFQFSKSMKASADRTRAQMANADRLRRLHQGMIVFANDNNTYLPGLDSQGKILSPESEELSKITNNKFSGAAMSSRYYILLNRKYVSPEQLANPMDQIGEWKFTADKAPGTDQFSFALLRIGAGPDSTDIGNNQGRIAEWRDNGNSQALLISDRNIAADTQPQAVRSVWSVNSQKPNQWSGTVVWADNHSEYLSSPGHHDEQTRLFTRYGKAVNSNDFLFSEQDMPGKVGSASAMFGYTHDNY
jgi:hypothetical protein